MDADFTPPRGAVCAFVPIEEIAAALDRTPRRAYQLIAAGEIPAVKVGGRVRVPRPTWEAYLTALANLAVESIGGATTGGQG